MNMLKNFIKIIKMMNLRDNKINFDYANKKISTFMV